MEAKCDTQYLFDLLLLIHCLDQAASYTVSKYDFDEIHDAFEHFKKAFPDDEIRAALWNVTEAVRKPFLEMSKEEIQRMSDSDVVAGFSFAQEAIKAFKELS